MDYTIKCWEENTDFEELKRWIGDRKVAVWGAYVTGKYVREILVKRGIVVSFYIDGHKETCEYDNLPIRKPDEEIEKDVYIFIAVIGVREEIVHYLDSRHMKKGGDYTYISKILPHVVITECTGGYADNNGNRLECEDDQLKCKIEFKGFNSRIKIGKDFVAQEGATIIVENGSEIIIGNYVSLYEDITVEAYSEGKIEIGNNFKCLKDSIITCHGGEITIGDYVSTGRRFFCTNGKPCVINIGNDCMFSHDISILGGGHSIFDIDTRENIIRKHQNITIGNHVWLGKNVVVLHNADIGNGCIIGASSVAKLKTEENCVIAGNPAKVIKTKHIWDRRLDIEFEDV